MRGIWILAIVALACGSDGSSEHAASSERAGETPPAEPASPTVDPDSVWAAVEKQMAFGPRVPGTPGHEACGQWLANRLAAVGGAVEVDTFKYRDTEGVTWPLQNILASFGPPGNNRLLLVAHWDTRPWSDMDPDPKKRSLPVPGANDGGSGVAVLLEVARVLEGVTLPRGVDILLADGEDLGREGSNIGFCRGTRRFAGRDLSRYHGAVVLDMVGDADLRFPVEQYSMARAPEMVDWVWRHGMAEAPAVFTMEVGMAVFDDHIPLLDAGLPAVDIIDFDYPAWHTQRDDLTAVSRESLALVGRVVLRLILDPGPRPGGG